MLLIASAIRSSEVDDVREVLHYYKQFEDPIEAFRENQRKLQDEMTALEEKQTQERQAKSSSLLSAFRKRWNQQPD